MTPNAKFHVNLHKGASRQIGKIYAKFFVAIGPYNFFQKLTYRSDPSADFCVRRLKRRGLAQGRAFLEIKKLEINI